ncbi:MAG: toll/interleukin-1 receptor domain-containing protein [Gemmatimonas sp.]
MDAPLEREWDFFDDLILHIESGDVIPIIGAELLEIDVGGRQVLLDRWIAEQLMHQLKLDVSQFPADYALADIVAWVNRNKKPIHPMDLYGRVHALVEKLGSVPPPGLLELAGIRDFRIYVSATFDELMHRALLQARGDASLVLDSLAFATTQREKTAWYRDQPAGTAFVYHVFGRTSNRQTFVLSDEDKLEWLLAMLPTGSEPRQLFDEMSRKHLLFLGIDFPDWLARFFLRVTKRTPLSAGRAEQEVFAGTHIAGDRPLTGFLEAYSVRTRVYPGTAREFVSNLYQRWMQRNGNRPLPTTRAVTAPAGVERETQRARDHVFLSYRREDKRVAEEIRVLLENAGVDVWMDTEIPGGVEWDRRIRHAIAECLLFIAIVTPEMLTVDESYFLEEWRLAVDRRRRMNAARPFIVPIAVGDVNPQHQDLPSEFSSSQWSTFVPGTLGEKLCRDVVDAVRSVRSRRSGALVE